MRSGSTTIPGYHLAPGTVIGCAVLRQERLVYENVKALLAQGSGSPLYGKADIVGAKEGYVDFAGDDPAYLSLPKEARDRRSKSRLGGSSRGLSSFPVEGL